MNQIGVLQRIVDNMEKVIVDKKQEIILAVITVVCKGHILIEDVPGVGKTSLASALAKSLSCSFTRIQFTPDIMPSDVTGFSIYNPQNGSFEYKRGAILGNVVLADEINRASPKTQSSLLEAMEERQVTVDGITYRIREPFIVLATQNPLDYLGTYPLPEAQMDRFFMRISLGYPSKGEEMRLIDQRNSGNPLRDLQPVASAQEIVAVQDALHQVYVDAKINEYIVNLVRHTRENPQAALGASPCASLNLYKGAQAWALCQGRSFVTPDDVIRMAKPVLTHRLIIKPEYKLKNIGQADLVTEALNATKVPVL